MTATELWNNWFTLNHANNINSVLVEEFNGPIRGRKLMKLRRDDERSKSAQAYSSHKSLDRVQLGKHGKMG